MDFSKGVCEGASLSHHRNTVRRVVTREETRWPISCHCTVLAMLLAVVDKLDPPRDKGELLADRIPNTDITWGYLF